MERPFLRIRPALNFALTTYRSHFRLFTAVMLTLFGAWAALEVIVILGQELGLVWWTAAHLTFFILFAGLEAGFFQICLALHDDETVAYATLFTHLRWGALFFTGQPLYLFMILARLVLFIIPGIYLGTRYALFFALIPPTSSLQHSIRQSATLTEGVRLSLAKILFFQVLLNVLGASILGVGLIITAPLSVLMIVWAYRLLAGESKYESNQIVPAR